jgi:hypothetical protein
MFRRALPLVLIVIAAACGKDSPTSPTPSTPTREIAITGTLVFGDVEVGSTADRTFRIHNTGADALTVTSLSSQSPANFPVSWSSGIIPAGGTQDVTVRFSPTEARIYDTVLRVNGNQTAGNNGINISAIGVRTGPLWERSGTGADVFDMPTYIRRVRITGTYSGSCENFIIRVGGSTVVNVILGTCSVADARNYEGVHAVTGGQVEVRSSIGINWRFTEVR